MSIQKEQKHLIVGCGDVGTRIAKVLGEPNVCAVVATQNSKDKLSNLGIDAHIVNLDKSADLNALSIPAMPSIENIFYLVPPQKSGETDERSKHFLAALTRASRNTADDNTPKRIVLISTTGVYGDHAGEWVTEECPANPQTPRAVRRWNMEQQWTDYAKQTGSIISTLRVPGIYSHTRLPRERIEKGIPIVNPEECGYTNRIHADDLAAICVNIMQQQTQSDVYNATDGTPGKISEYLLAVAKELKLPQPPLIPMAEAEEAVSAGMLSYLRESRKIANQKLLNSFTVSLKYPDFRIGIKH